MLPPLRPSAPPSVLLLLLLLLQTGFNAFSVHSTYLLRIGRGGGGEGESAVSPSLYLPRVAAAAALVQCPISSAAFSRQNLSGEYTFKRCCGDGQGSMWGSPLFLQLYLFFSPRQHKIKHV